MLITLLIFSSDWYESGHRPITTPHWSIK